MSDPTTVRGDQVRAALTALGVVDQQADIMRTEITPQRITVERLRRNSGGQIVAVGDKVAAVITEIGIEWEAGQ